MRVQGASREQRDKGAGSPRRPVVAPGWQGRGFAMNSIFYLIGVVVVILAVLSLLGLR